MFLTGLSTGMSFRHSDLWDNFVSLIAILRFSIHTVTYFLQAPQVSYDFVEDDFDPSRSSQSHGTKVGGIIGAGKNDVCGVGIAHKVNLAGEFLHYTEQFALLRIVRSAFAIYIYSADNENANKHVRVLLMLTP